MKKILFVFPIMVLLAVGCSSSKQANNQAPISQNTNSAATPKPTPVPTTTTQNIRGAAQQPTPAQTVPSTKNIVTPKTTSQVALQTCVNNKYGYTVSYPVGWNIYIGSPSGGQQINCPTNESLIIISQSGKDNEPGISLEATNAQDQPTSTSLDAFVKSLTSAAPFFTEYKETTLASGDKLVWLLPPNDTNHQHTVIVGFKNNTEYLFSTSNMDDNLLNTIADNFSYTK